MPPAMCADDTGGEELAIRDGVVLGDPEAVVAEPIDHAATRSTELRQRLVTARCSLRRPVARSSTESFGAGTG